MNNQCRFGSVHSWCWILWPSLVDTWIVISDPLVFSWKEQIQMLVPFVLIVEKWWSDDDQIADRLIVKEFMISRSLSASICAGNCTLSEICKVHFTKRFLICKYNNQSCFLLLQFGSFICGIKQTQVPWASYIALRIHGEGSSGGVQPRTTQKMLLPASILLLGCFSSAFAAGHGNSMGCCTEKLVSGHSSHFLTN